MRVCNRHDPLRLRIHDGIDAQVGESTHRVVGAVRPALVLAHHRNPIGVVAVGPQPRGVVDRNAGVVAKLGTGNAVGQILVVKGRPVAGEIDLRPRRDGDADRHQSRTHGGSQRNGGVR